MLWLFPQILIWIVVALLAGVLAGWWFWARPLQQATGAVESGAVESGALESGALESGSAGGSPSAG